MRIKNIQAFSFVFILFGYGYIGLLVQDSDKSQTLTIPYRLSVLLLSCFILTFSFLSKSKREKRKSLNFSNIETQISSIPSKKLIASTIKLSGVLIYIFICLYSIKFVIDVYGKQLVFGNYTYYLTFWFLVCLLPGLVFSRIEWGKPWKYLLFSHVAMLGFSLLMIYNNSTFYSSSFISQGRFSGAALNPISLGAFSGTIILIGLYIMILAKLKEFRTLKVSIKLVFITCIFSVMVGSYYLIAAASRGPIIATVICLTILAFSSVKKSSIFLTLLLLVGYFFFSRILLPLIKDEGIINTQRLLLINIDEDRFHLINLSVEIFFENLYNFFVGFGPELPNYGYPHNIVVESFLSTGIFGGCLFLCICIIAVVRSFELLVYVKPWGWLGLLFIFNLILGLFSGSLYLSYTFWYLLFAVNSLWMSYIKEGASHFSSEYNRLETLQQITVKL